MTVFWTLIRKHVLESRWVLGLSFAAFFALSILTVWLTLRGERAIDRGELGQEGGRGLRVYIALGGPAMDYSTLAMEVAFWNHPLIILTVLGWSITRGAAAVSGEIERGTLDLVLSRPVSRSGYLGSHIAFTVVGLVGLVLALIAGNLVGSLFYAVKSPPGVISLLRPGTMIVMLGLAVYGYTLPFSTIDIVRWRPSLIATAATLAGLIGLTVARQLEGYDWLEKTSVFQAYAPVTVALKGDPLAYNSAVLASVFAVGVGLSFLAFSTRDLPSNS
jgi:ABC-2 type transport system permease protein